MKFAPGPWAVMRLEVDRKGWEWTVQLKAKFDERLDPFHAPSVIDGSGWMQEGTARLISAAPDLYEALEGFVKRTRGLSSPPPECLVKAEAALAKARGETSARASHMEEKP